MTRSHRNEDRGGEHRWTFNGVEYPTRKLMCEARRAEYVRLLDEEGMNFTQAARAFPLIPFERFHKWNVVSTGSHVAGESVRHFWMVRHFETTILLVGVQHGRLLVLPAMLTRVQRRHHAVSRIHAACLALTGCQAFSNV